MPVFHLLSRDVVRDGKALFGVVSGVIKVLYLVVAHGCVDFFAVQDCAEGSGEASCVGSCSASVGILRRPDDILFQDLRVLKVGGGGITWWQSGVLDDRVGKMDLSWCRHAACLCPWGVTITLCGVNLGGALVTLRDGTLGGVLGALPIGNLGGAPVTLRDCKWVAESCRRAWFKGVAVGVNGGAGPFCMMAWMRSLTAAAVRSEVVTCGMVYVVGKKATLSLLQQALVAEIYMQ